MAKVKDENGLAEHAPEPEGDGEEFPAGGIDETLLEEEAIPMDLDAQFP
jgi:hypothetical protein